MQLCNVCFSLFCVGKLLSVCLSICIWTISVRVLTPTATVVIFLNNVLHAAGLDCMNVKYCDYYRVIMPPPLVSTAE